MSVRFHNISAYFILLSLVTTHLRSHGIVVLYLSRISSGLVYHRISLLGLRKGANYFRGGMHNFVQAKQEINAIFGHLTKYLEVCSEFSADYRIADEDERDIDKFSSEVRVLIIAQTNTL